MVVIANSPEEVEVDEIKHINVVRTPLVDLRIREIDVQSDIKILLLLISELKLYDPNYATRREQRKRKGRFRKPESPGPECGEEG